jgi:hypothetical protein
MSTTETKTSVTTDFPGLERNALQMFGIPYAELPVRFQAGVRKVTKQDAAEEMLVALKACQSLIEFYAEREMSAPANNQEAVRDTRDKLMLYRAAIAKAEGQA